jgi:hypothetical protein
MGRMNGKKRPMKDTPNKPLPDYKWQDHTPANPFWDSPTPVEIQLFDETTELIGNPAKAKAEYETSGLVRWWRNVPEVYWPEGVNGIKKELAADQL